VDRVKPAAEGGVAVVVIDNPPVNALDRAVRADLAAALARLAADASVEAIVITGEGRTFVAGADILELEAAVKDHGVEPPDFHDLLGLVEDCPKPVIAALGGVALGGGLELAMAAHYRVASPHARLGLPEVNLGIIPGAEGTQRLPRLVGLEKALAMCVSGRPIDAEEARGAGLVDLVVDGDLRAGAAAFARAARPPHPRTRERRDKLVEPAQVEELLAGARETARKTRRHQTAPLAAIEALGAAVTLPWEEGLRLERALSREAVRSPQAAAMVHGFLAERATARVPGLSRGVAGRGIETVAVIGAGTMGTGIAMACANAGLAVTLGDSTPEALERGLAAIRGRYQSSVDRGRLSADSMAERLGRVRGIVGYEGCGAADLVIEAVFEDLALKKEVFAEIGRRTRPETVLASNTSTLDVDQIAAASGRPGSVLGLHFFSPAHVMRLLEIVRGSKTDDAVLATALGFARRLSKVGVVVRNAPGFVGNRIMFPYMYEAQFLVEDGATPEQVDRALTGWGMAMGIFAVDDMGGLDVAWRIRRELRQFEGEDVRKPLVADRLVEMGRLGQKTGRGWFLYEDGKTPAPDPEVVALVDEIARAHGLERRAVSDEEILERTVYALVNEAARVLGDGVASRAADIDVVYLTGYGFPSFRGGPLFYADSVGLQQVHARLAEYRRTLGPRWEPAPLLARLAREGSSFRQYDAAVQEARAPEASA
jgi:3-hydroxyacyl-CoA dehydrogenase